MLNYLTFTTTIEILCFLVAFICLSEDSHRTWKYFSVFLLITCLAELSGIYLKRNQHPYNAWVYNILMVFEVGFVNLMYWNIFKRIPKAKITIVCGIVLFALLYAFELLNHSAFVYNDMSYTVFSVIVVIYALFYYYRLMNNDSYIRIGYSAEFWWVTGALF